MSQCNQCCRTPCECMDGGETERDATTNTDPEAIARRIVEFDARYQATRSLPLGSSERRDAFLSAMQSSIDDAPTLAAAYLDLRAQRDELREAADDYRALVANAYPADSFGKRKHAMERLTKALEAAR